MITWIQNLLQKHHKWLFSILLIVIIIAFVFTIGNMPVGQGSSNEYGEKEFYGFDLNDMQVTDMLAKGVALTNQIDRGSPMYREQEQQIVFSVRTFWPA